MELVKAPKGITPLELAQTMAWLMYSNSVPMGMGFLHFREDNLDDKQTLFDEMTASDKSDTHGKESNFYMDYVNGRMVKSNIMWNNKGVHLPSPEDDIQRADYQSWSNAFDGVRGVYDEAVRLITGVV